MASTQNEEIFQFLTGTDDNGQAINFNVETKKNNVSVNFEHIINPIEIIVDVETGNNIQIMIAFDDGPFKPVGVVGSGCTRLSLDTDAATGDFPRCRQVTIAYREFSKSAVRIGQMALNYYDTDEVEDIPEV